MIQTTKIVTTLMILKWMDSLSTLGQFEIERAQSFKSFRMDSFCIRAIDKLKNLMDDVVNSSAVLSFKTMYGRYMWDQKYHNGDIY